MKNILTLLALFGLGFSFLTPKQAEVGAEYTIRGEFKAKPAKKFYYAKL